MDGEDKGEEEAITKEAITKEGQEAITKVVDTIKTGRMEAIRVIHPNNKDMDRKRILFH